MDEAEPLVSSPQRAANRSTSPFPMAMLEFPTRPAVDGARRPPAVRAGYCECGGPSAPGVHPRTKATWPSFDAALGGNVGRDRPTSHTGARIPTILTTRRSSPAS